MKTVTLQQKQNRIGCKVYFRRSDRPVNLDGLNEVFSHRREPVILGGNSQSRYTKRFSYWSAGPREVFEFRSNQSKPFVKLRHLLDRYRLDELPQGLPSGVFCGGWVGYFAYELARYIEKLPQTTRDDFDMPLIRLGLYDKVICLDHSDSTCWLIAVGFEDDRVSPEEKLAELEHFLELSNKEITIPESGEASANIDYSRLRCNMDKNYYLESVEKIRRYIYDGEVYQVNFSQRFEAEYSHSPIELFHWQNRYNPSGYAAYIGGEDFHIISTSPEMFITIENGFIRTRPIKGTRARIEPRRDKDDYARRINEKNFAELLESEKEQAELNMIIDLERNDLGRICRFGTIKVIQPRTIESYPTVLHAVATVRGELPEKNNMCDILRAMFPGGSITGAPKIRATEIIDELEPTQRGVYTGCIGCLGLNKTACLNIAIRTIIIRNRRAFFQVGGGIVADSTPQAEWRETLVKAKAMAMALQSLGG